MLNVMRENLRSLKWVLWAVAAAMVLSLGLFFDCGGGSGPGQNTRWAATVNGVVIPETRFLTTARNFDRYFREMFGDSYNDIKPQLQIGSQAVQALIEQEMILQDAGELGLAASKDDVARAIRTHPNLKDAGGQFVGKETYVQMMGRAPGGVAAFEKELAEQIVLDKWTAMVTQTVTVDEFELEELHRQRTVKTAIDYVLVASADQEFDTALDDAELLAYYEENPDRYQRPAGRNIRYVVVDRETQLAQVDVSAEQVRQNYDDNPDEHTRTAQRQARHILFRTPPGSDADEKQSLRTLAEGVLERLKNGEDFAALARAMSQDPGSAQNGGDLGFFTTGDMVPAFEAAAFATPEGEFAPVTETEIGFHVIQVTGSKDAGLIPFEEVEAGLKRSMELEIAQQRVVSEAERIRAAVQTAEQLATTAAENSLPVETRFISAGDRLADLGASPEFAEALFALDPGGVGPPLRVASGMAIAVVDEEVPPALAPYDDIETSVRTDLLNARAVEAALQEARRALERGTDVAGAAKRLDTETTSSGDLAPGQGLPGSGGSTAEFQDAMFAEGLAVGSRGVIEVPAGALIYEVTGRTEFDFLAFEMAKPDLRTELLQQRRSQLRQSILDGMRSNQEIQVNDELVLRLNS